MMDKKSVAGVIQVAHPKVHPFDHDSTYLGRNSSDATFIGLKTYGC